MEKILQIGTKEIKLKSTAGTMMRYRNYFNRDFLKDLINLQRKLNDRVETGSQFEAIDLDIFEKITWCMAKTADNSIPDIEHWLDDFETFDIMQILPQIMELLISNMEQINKPQNERGRRSKKRVDVNSNTVILRCLKIGMSLSDMDNVTIGFILDLVEENNREVEEANAPTEADSDTLHRFFR